MTIENSDPSVNRMAEVCKLEEMLDMVSSPSNPGLWETIVNKTFDVVLESSFSETFCNITEEMKQENVTKVYHLLALYALFVDVMTLCAKNSM